jgi:hypothetical protein
MNREPDKDASTDPRRQLVFMLDWWHCEFLKNPVGIPGSGSWSRMEQLVNELGRRRGFKVDRPGLLAKVITQVDREYPKLGLLTTVTECYRRLLQCTPAPHLRILALASEPRFREEAELLRRTARLVESGKAFADGPTAAELRLLYVPLARLRAQADGKLLDEVRNEYAKTIPAAYSEAGFREALGPADAVLARLRLVELTLEEVRWWSGNEHARGLAQQFLFADWPNAAQELVRIFPYLTVHDYRRHLSDSAEARRLRKRKQRGRDRIRKAKARLAAQ